MTEEDAEGDGVGLEPSTAQPEPTKPHQTSHPKREGLSAKNQDAIAS